MVEWSLIKDSCRASRIILLFYVSSEFFACESKEKKTFFLKKAKHRIWFRPKDFHDWKSESLVCLNFFLNGILLICFLTRENFPSIFQLSRFSVRFGDRTDSNIDDFRIGHKSRKFQLKIVRLRKENKSDTKSFEWCSLRVTFFHVWDFVLPKTKRHE